MKNLNIHSESETIIQQISVKLNDFIEKAQMCLLQEKLLFRNNILVFFTEGFNFTLDCFLPYSGEDYLNSSS